MCLFFYFSPGGIIGAIIGGLLGVAIGPIAIAILGILGSCIGHQLWRSHQEQTYRKQQQKQASSFFMALFVCLGRLAKSDGVVTREEIAFVSLLCQRWDFSENDIALVQQAFLCGRDSREPFANLVRKMQQVMPHDSSAPQSIVQVMCTLVACDDRISQNELNLLYEAEQILGVAGTVRDFFQQESSQSEAEAKASSTTQKCYQVLGVSSEASDAEIIKAYRTLAKKYHPDVVAGSGMSDEYVKYANRKMQEINAAFSEIESLRGQLRA